MHLIKKTLFVSTLSLLSIVSLQSSASAQTFALERNLSFGDTGNDVSSLQEFLREEGFFNEEVTGYFGPLTQEAVLRYQVANDIEIVDGSFALEVKSAETSELSASTAINTSTSTVSGLTHTRGTTAYSTMLKSGNAYITIDPSIAATEKHDGKTFNKLHLVTFYARNSETGELDKIKELNQAKLTLIFNALPIISNGNKPVTLASLNIKKYLKDDFDQFVVVVDLRRDNSSQLVSQIVYTKNTNTNDVDPSITPVLKIKKVKGVKGSYKPGEEIKFTVAGIKSVKNKKAPALPTEGYHVQSHIKTVDGNGISSLNAEYNSNKKVWEVETLVPSTAGKYVVSASLYCTDTSKECGTYADEVEQVDWTKKINVKGKSVATTTTPTTPQPNATSTTYTVTVDNLSQSNTSYNVKWSGSTVSSPVLQIKCSSKETLFSSTTNKDVKCPKVKWSTVAEYTNQTAGTFALSSKNGDYAKVSVRVGLEGKQKSFDEKVFIMESKPTSNTTTTQNTSDDEEEVDDEDENEDIDLVTPTNTQTNTSTNTSTNTTTVGISDETHKCFARQTIRTPWIPVKCSSKAFENAAKVNKMTILRKNKDE